MAEKEENIVKEAPKHGKKPNQRLKPYLVLQYLMRETDENHLRTAADIVSYLMDDCGIYAERRSIYADIEEINKALLIVEQGMTAKEAEETLAEYEDEKLVVYDRSRKGFYVRERRYDANDIRLLAECVYSAKFLTQGQADRLAGVVCGFVSDYQAESIQHDALLTDRVKTSNKAVLSNISTINDAMSKELDGEKHEPEKITFKYLRCSISDLTQQVERRKGERYTVSPYKLLINDGYYYLLSFDEEKKEMRTYRVDRMRDVRFTGQPREGEEVFRAIDMKTYTQRVFSMFGGERQRVTLRFTNNLLDAVVDRFGTQGVSYWQEDERHFCAAANVEISNPFFGWLLGFGNMVKIMEPQPIVERFTAYLDKVRGLY